MMKVSTRSVISVMLASSVVMVGVPTMAMAATQNQGVVATGNGTAGVAQTVSVVAPKSANSTLEVVASLGGAGDVISVKLDSRGQGSVSWTPQSSGTWTVGSSGDGISLVMSKPVIAAVPTTNDIYIANKAERFKPMGLISVVTATEGNAAVAGTVTFYEANRGRLGAVNVQAGQGEKAVANLTWTPPAQSTYAFHSVFTPANDAETGTAATQASDSGVSYLEVTESAVPVQLLMPPVMRVGHPAPVFAQLPEINRASVRLDVDGRPVSPSKSTEGGLAEFAWTPTHTGLTYVQLELEGTHHPLADRLVTQTINVQPDRIPNPISVSPVVNGVVGAPWADGQLVTYPAGASVSLVTSSGNGAVVTFKQIGKCQVKGTTLTLPVTGGGCSVTFSAPGDATYASNSATVIVSSSVESANG